MKKMFITLIMILLNIIILNSKTFMLDNINFKLFSKKGNLNEETNIFAIANSDKSEELFNMPAEKTETGIAKKRFFYVKISPALLPGIALGYGGISNNENDKNCKEIIYFLHANSIFMISSAGVGIFTNIFKNPERKGFFFSLTVGADYIWEPKGILSPGGPTETDIEEHFFPNIALGEGYSLKIGKTSFLRISLDIGVKYLLTNFNISCVF